MFDLFPFETYSEKLLKNGNNSRSLSPWSTWNYVSTLPDNVHERKMDNGDTLLLFPVPGLDKKDITIREDSNTLCVSYTKDKEDNRHLLLNSFEYKIKLPYAAEKIIARVENGLLTVLLEKKREEKKTRLIEIT